MGAQTEGYVIFVGSADIDENYDVAYWPSAGGKTSAKYAGTVAGGMIANAACVCAGYGVKTYCFDCNGADPQYDFLFEDLRRNHVDTSMVVRKPGVEEGKCLVFRLPDGDRSIVCVSGNKQPLELTQQQRDFFMGARAVYATLWMDRTVKGAKQLLRELKESGVTVMYDAESNSWREDWQDFFSCASIVSMNEYSAERFRGDMSMKEFCRKVFDLGVQVILLTLGKDGCRLLTRDGDTYIPAYDLQVVDTTGCGDTFNATFLAATISGMAPERAVGYANAAANMAATVAGPRGGITTFQKVEQFLSRMGCKEESK